MATVPVFTLAVDEGGIVKGSAIVGPEGSEDLAPHEVFLAYIEGDIYGFIGGDWEMRVLHAADRMLTNYPTVAKRHLQRGLVNHVGYWNHETKTLDVTEQALLDDWRSP